MIGGSRLRRRHQCRHIGFIILPNAHQQLSIHFRLNFVAYDLVEGLLDDFRFPRHLHKVRVQVVVHLLMVLSDRLELVVLLAGRVVLGEGPRVLVAE